MTDDRAYVCDVDSGESWSPVLYPQLDAVYTQKLVQSFSHRSLYTGTCGHRSFYTESILRQRICYKGSLCAHKLLHRNAFAQKSRYTRTVAQKPLQISHTEAFRHRSFTQRSLYTQKLSHTHNHGALARLCYIHKLVYTQKL